MEQQAGASSDELRDQVTALQHEVQELRALAGHLQHALVAEHSRGHQLRSIVAQHGQRIHALEQELDRQRVVAYFKQRLDQRQRRKEREQLPAVAALSAFAGAGLAGILQETR